MLKKNTSPQKIAVGEISDSPLGQIAFAVSELGLVAVEIGIDLDSFTMKLAGRLNIKPVLDEALTAEVAHQLIEYFNGQRQYFDLKIDWRVVTRFQEHVLRAQMDIPYGETRSYGEIARQLGKPQAARAVGRAGATNPMPLVIPCHRVVGVDGRLRGYGAPGGVKTKAWLLEHERNYLLDPTSGKIHNS